MLKREGRSSRNCRKKRLSLRRLWRTRLSGWKRKRKRLARGCLMRERKLKLRPKLREKSMSWKGRSLKLRLDLLARPQPPRERTKATSE